MQIRKEDDRAIDQFLNDFVNALKRRSSSTVYKIGSAYRPGSGYIELANGFLLPEEKESVLVLDKEYDQYLVENLLILIKNMLDSLESPLFGFAERPLYDFITTWFFVNFHTEVDPKLKNRVRTLLFAGHFKYFGQSVRDFENYLKQREHYLLPKDIRYVRDEGKTAESYFDRLYDIVRQIKQSFGPDLYESILGLTANYTKVLSYQHMVVHANPLSISEVFRNKTTKTRRKVLLIILTAQVCDYLKKEEVFSTLLGKYSEIRSSIQVKIT